MENNTTCWITERAWVGPDADAHVDDTTYTITTEQPVTNMSGQPIDDGWLGTTGDWAGYAHCRYGSEAEAREALAAMLPDGWREEDATLEYEPGVLLRVRPGRLEPWSAADSRDWWGDSGQITAETPDEEIAQMVADAAAELAADESVRLDCDSVEEMLRNRRDAAQEAA